MFPYRGRLRLRIARAALALTGLGWHEIAVGAHSDGLTALLAVYALFALYSLPEKGRESRWRDAVSLSADAAYFGLWSRVAPGAWIPVAALSYLLTSVVVLHESALTLAVATVALLLSLLLPARPSAPLAWTTAAFGGLAIAMAFYKRYLNGRMSATLRQNVLARSQTESVREDERARIAADFHDGPLQHFISFQMRLEVIKKLLGRGNAGAAAEELDQLQGLCRNQVADLQSFARSMRPPEEGLDFIDSLSRMVDVFQRDTGIASTISLDGTERLRAAPELLQIVREALHNIHKHSGASRVLVSAAPNGQSLQITVEDNGSGFPFSGKYTLDELERQRLGPISIKRRIRLLNGDLVIESHPGQGARLEIRIPT